MARVPRPTPAPAQPRPGVRQDPWIEHLAWLMDSSIGIGRWSIGLDGLLGLVPGFGDLAGSLVSMLIVTRAVRAGVPRIAIARMVANVAIDALAGAVPLAGDLFDFAYKANMKNLRIYQEYAQGARATNLRHWGFFAVLAVALLAVLAIPIAIMVLAVRAATQLQ
jgi:hypothetical protein